LSTTNSSSSLRLLLPDSSVKKSTLLSSSSFVGDTDNNERPISGARKRRATFGRPASLSGLRIGETNDSTWIVCYDKNINNQ
jgi:hypothetical protein